MNGENWVVKSNALIEAKGRMTALEQKFILNLISEITPDDKDFKEYRLSVAEIKKELGITDKNIYQVLKDVANGLMDRKIEIERINSKGKRSFLVTRYLSSAEYVEGEGEIKVNFDPKLKPYLLQLKEMFTQYQLKNILKLKGSHSIRIYELLKQYERIGKREFEIEELKKLLGVTDGYERFYDFERRILEPSKTEINEKTDIWIDYQKIKEGRRIAKIRFEIEPKFINQENEEIKAYKENGIFDFDNIRKNSGLANENFNDKQVMELYEIAVNMVPEGVSPYEYIRLNYLNMIEKGTAKNKFAWLKKALIEDYAVAKAQISLDYYIND